MCISLIQRSSLTCDLKRLDIVVISDRTRYECRFLYQFHSFCEHITRSSIVIDDILDHIPSRKLILKDFFIHFDFLSFHPIERESSWFCFLSYSNNSNIDPCFSLSISEGSFSIFDWSSVVFDYSIHELPFLRIWISYGLSIHQTNDVSIFCYFPRLQEVIISIRERRIHDNEIEVEILLVWEKISIDELVSFPLECRLKVDTFLYSK